MTERHTTRRAFLRDGAIVAGAAAPDVDVRALYEALGISSNLVVAEIVTRREAALGRAARPEELEPITRGGLEAGRDGRLGLYNLTGQPAMSVRLRWTDDGIPVGVMFAGRFGEEATLFRLAARLEAEAPWLDRLPPI